MKYIVGFSGGVDSQACALWVRNRYPREDVILMNTDAGGNEHPLTMQFVEDYSQKVFPVTKVTALIRDMWKTEEAAEARGYDGEQVLDFTTMCRIKRRAPSRKAQFCTEILKLRPQRRWCDEHISDEYERYTGVRRDESEARRDSLLREWDTYFDCWVNRPLADWTKQMCFDYVRAAGEEVNPLYKLGFKRVGCAPCINSSKEDIRLWVERFPEMIDKIRRLEQSTGTSFFAPRVPGIINKIDEIVEWSKTDYGGRQFFIFQDEHPACESKYGLCE